MTPEGERVLTQGQDLMERVLQESFRPLEDDEREVFADALKRLLAT